MKASAYLIGYFETIGEIDMGDLALVENAPGLVIRRSDESTLVIAGLTKEEVRYLAPMFMRDVTVSIQLDGE